MACPTPQNQAPRHLGRHGPHRLTAFSNDSNEWAMAKLCETLRLLYIGAGFEARHELSKVLRNFETQIRVV
jgi:hypothetical protein